MAEKRTNNVRERGKISQKGGGEINWNDHGHTRFGKQLNTMLSVKNARLGSESLFKVIFV